jgi:hypothetical protein
MNLLTISFISSHYEQSRLLKFANQFLYFHEFAQEKAPVLYSKINTVGMGGTH